jgi:hypothetical protein
MSQGLQPVVYGSSGRTSPPPSEPTTTGSPKRKILGSAASQSNRREQILPIVGASQKLAQTKMTAHDYRALLLSSGQFGPVITRARRVRYKNSATCFDIAFLGFFQAE